MKLINEIVEARNFWEAWMSVRRNKGAAGIDKMSVDVLDVYMPQHMDEIKYQRGYRSGMIDPLNKAMGRLDAPLTPSEKA